MLLNPSPATACSSVADTVGARLARLARRHPARTAVVERDARITFRELDGRASAIAARLREVADDRAERVCLLFESKLAALGALFGVARNGNAYVLLDAGDPEERLRFILADCTPRALLTETALLARARAIAPSGCAVLDIAAGGDEAPIEVEDRAETDDPVYLCYTSGSTGKPKGVMQTHRNLLFFADAYAKALQVTPDDRASLVYTLSFNAANMDIFGALLSGAALCAYDLRRDGMPNVADWLDRERITVLHAVPTVYREVFERMPAGRVLPHLRVIDLGGEAVFASDLALFRGHTLPRCTFVNQLASTEVGLIAQHVVTHAASAAALTLVPAGRCPPGVDVRIRRDDGTPAGVDEPGEMVVCSRHVSPGYWRRPELDAHAFGTDPRDPSVRCYVSGDMGRVDAAGNLHFLGRRGSRVKVRGHSVDLAEVEAALAACPGVAKAAVLAQEEAGAVDSARLAAFVAMKPDAARDAPTLRRALARVVPAYMSPADIVFMAALPVTPSGKIDRQALARAGMPTTDPSPRRVDPPRDAIEESVARIVAELVGVDVGAVGRDDDFYLLGGDSLRAVQLQLRVRQAFGVHLGHLHEDATVSRIAGSVRERTRSAGTGMAMPVLVPLWRQGSAPPLFLVHGRHGQAFVSPHFMQLLGDDQPVWAFQARGLDGLHPPHASVEAMAADYLAELRRERPHGPYFLGALCAGAFIAAVMARELAHAGELVLPLLLLDPPDRLLMGGYGQMSEERFMQKMQARRAMGRSGGPADDPAYLQSVHRVALAFEQAIAAYRPIPYAGPAFMLSSRQRSAVAGADGVNRICSGTVTRYEVGGTHAEALDPRNPVFANHLLRCVAEIREASRAGAAAPTAVTAPT